MIDEATVIMVALFLIGFFQFVVVVVRNCFEKKVGQETDVDDSKVPLLQYGAV